MLQLLDEGSPFLELSPLAGKDLYGGWAAAQFVFFDGVHFWQAAAQFVLCTHSSTTCTHSSHVHALCNQDSAAAPQPLSPLAGKDLYGGQAAVVHTQQPFTPSHTAKPSSWWV